MRKKSNFFHPKVAYLGGKQMGGNATTTSFLKECMADSLLNLMKNEEFSKITVNEISEGAGVNRSTWFRNFSNKNEALTFKLVHSWKRWTQEHGLAECHRYTLDNANDFFEFNYANRQILTVICDANLQSTIYDAFYQIMMPQFGADAEECYESRFYANGLFGLLDEWVKRKFLETPEEIAQLFQKIITNHHRPL